MESIPNDVLTPPPTAIPYVRPLLIDTPHYSIMAEVPFRILERYGKHAFDGSVKFIVLLREPVARMISSWQYKFDGEFRCALAT